MKCLHSTALSIFVCVYIYRERVCVVISVFIFVEDLQKKQEKALEPIIHALYIYIVLEIQ